MKKKLYLGIDPPSGENIIHYPIIKTIPKSKAECHLFLSRFLSYTDLIFTSKTAVKIFFDYLSDFSFSQDEINQKKYIAVGTKTALALTKFGVRTIDIAEDETQEGVVELLKNRDLKKSFIFWPHSSLSRSVLTDFFLKENLKFEAPSFYETEFILTNPIPDFEIIDEIFFTSPSTVDAFFQIIKELPKNIKLNAIGPITKQHLLRKGFCINLSDDLSCT